MIEQLKKAIDIINALTLNDWKERAERMEATNLIKAIIKELETEIK